MGAGWLGRGVGANEEKSETSRRKSQPLPGIPKVPKEKEQKNLDFLLCEQFTVHPRRASHLAPAKGRDGGVYSASWAQRPSGPAPGTVQAGVARGYSRSLSLTPPAPRQVCVLPGAPTGLCAACAPASVPTARGTAVDAGREAARRGGRGTQPAPVPAGGRGARGQRRRSRQAPAPTDRRATSGPWDQRSTGGCSTSPARRKGSPPRAVPLNTERPTLWLPTAGSHRNPATKSFATPKGT